MSFMFLHAEIFNQHIGSWNVSNAQEMMLMFGGAENFNQDTGAWDVSNIWTEAGYNPVTNAIFTLSRQVDLIPLLSIQVDF